jgi:hypothetical protein
MRNHFNELLLSALALMFAGLAVWMIKHGDQGDGFKWAAGIVGTIIGALLMKMQAKSDANTPAQVTQVSVSQDQAPKPGA